MMNHGSKLAQTMTKQSGTNNEKSSTMPQSMLSQMMNHGSKLAQSMTTQNGTTINETNKSQIFKTTQQNNKSFKSVCNKLGINNISFNKMTIEELLNLKQKVLSCEIKKSENALRSLNNILNMIDNQIKKIENSRLQKPTV